MLFEEGFFHATPYYIEPGASSIVTERCYFNYSQITDLVKKNVLLHRFNGVIRNEYEFYAVYANVPTWRAFRVRIL